jgi:hypothetical protein
MIASLGASASVLFGIDDQVGTSVLSGPCTPKVISRFASSTTDKCMTYVIFHAVEN